MNRSIEYILIVLPGDAETDIHKIENILIKIKKILSPIFNLTMRFPDESCSTRVKDFEKIVNHSFWTASEKTN